MNNQNYAKEATIAQIEKQKQFFEIPPYQRLYEWESTQIEELLNDMKKAFDLDKEKAYFIGNITTSIKNNKGEYDKTNDKQDKRYVLIDGQQRLTTLWFIGFYLASKGCDEWKEFITQDEKVRIAMSIRNNEEKALKELAMKIQNGTIKPNENSEINLYTYLPSDIHQKIINAFECIEKWFNAMFGKYANGKLEIDLKQLKCFSLFIYIRVCFVFVELAENTDLNRFFVRMNNRGKQLEKHEILKARILDKIKDDKSDEWQKYAKIWDLCSDMNKYIFQSASDRNILNSKSDDGEKWGIDKIISEFDDKNTKNTQNDDTPDKVESIIDFPTFLLHCYKLYSKDNNVSITKDKLLEIMWEKEKTENIDKINFKNSSKYCESFIKYILYYRVLFDYFVIKNNAEQGNGFRIRRLQSYKNKNQKTYYRLPEDSKSATDRPLHNLTMIQNYLRVARQGERQNYHHWLTPFLAYLDNEKISTKIWRIVKCNFVEVDKIVEFFKADMVDKECDESNMVKFLENLDIKLATYQLGVSVENKLIETTNKILENLNTSLSGDEQKMIDDFKELAKWNFLNNGTRTPHYWFYRLEYYLWKDRESKKYAEVNFDNKSFTDIADKFYFRNLNSVEHIQPQNRAEDEKKNWHIHKDNEGKIIKRDIDCFGNLALLSVGFNSSLSNQDNADKRLDLQKKINKSDVESLKLWLVYANYPKDEDWTCKNAKKHLVQMLKVLKESLGLNSK